MQDRGWRYWIQRKVAASLLSGICGLLGVFSLPAGALGAPLAQPRAIIPQESYEFGTVAQGTKVSHTFAIRNEGDAPLEIQRLVPGCGCTASRASADVVAPKGSAEILVEFDTTNFSGERDKKVRVFLNDPQQPIRELTIRGTIEPRVSAEPAFIDLGELARGSALLRDEHLVTIRVKEGESLRIGKAESSSGLLVIEEKSSSARSKVFSVRFKDSPPRGDLRDRIVVALEGEGAQQIAVPVIGFIRGAVTVKPGTVSFGIVEGKEILERSVRIDMKSVAPTQVVRVESSDPVVEAKLTEIEAGRHYVLKVRVDPSKVTRDLRATLVVTTSDPEEKSVSIPVFGILPPREG